MAFLWPVEAVLHELLKCPLKALQSPLLWRQLELFIFLQVALQRLPLQTIERTLGVVPKRALPVTSRSSGEPQKSLRS